MHLSSLDKMKYFRHKYLSGKEDDRLKIMDLGSLEIGGSYRHIFNESQWEYIGIDLVPGQNVDLVLSDPYSWVEIPSNSVDVFISGQAFEHIEFFWKTMLEIARVLRPGALCCIIAPSGGPEHRYPVDCWRFYPDGFRALAKWAKLDLLAVDTDWHSKGYSDGSSEWADTMMVAEKPMRVIPRTRRHVYRKEEIVEDAEDSLGRIKTFITPGAMVLELGPATGYFTKYLKDQLKCCVDCVEISPEMAKEAEPHCREMLIADLDNTDLLFHFKERQYDFIIFADVLEHLKDVEKTLKSCRKLLKKDGKCIISIPNIAHASVVGGLLKGQFEYTDEGLLDKTHLRFFTRDSVVNLLGACKYSIETIETITKLPEDTEIGDSLTDLSLELQNALLYRDDALVYQYVIVCCQGSNSDEPGDIISTPERVSAVDLRRAFLLSQHERIEALNRELNQAQTIAYDRLDQIKVLSAELKRAQILVRGEVQQLKEVEKGFALAEKLAFERMEIIKLLEEGLANAEQLAFQRLDTIESMEIELQNFQHRAAEMSKRIKALEGDKEHMANEIEQIYSSWLFRIKKSIDGVWGSTIGEK